MVTKTLSDWVGWVRFLASLAPVKKARMRTPVGMVGMFSTPLLTQQRTATGYQVTLNVQDRFSRLKLADQTSRIHQFAIWFADDILSDYGAKVTVRAALAGRVIGWESGGEWVWDEAYVFQIGQRLIATEPPSSSPSFPSLPR